MFLEYWGGLTLWLRADGAVARGRQAVSRGGAGEWRPALSAMNIGRRPTLWGLMRPDDGLADEDSPEGQAVAHRVPPEWGAQITGALAALLGVTVIVNWVLASYTDVDVAGSLSTLGQDAWCTPGSVGLGWHCWGDYTGIVFSSLTDAPKGAEIVYPMGTRLIRLPFLAAQTLWGVQAGLVLFLIVGFLCLALPFAWALRSKPWPTAAVEFTVACVATAPFLIVLDRGNMLVLVVPLLLAFLIAFIRDQQWVLVACVVAASTIKPQFAALALALVTLRHRRAFAASIAGVLVTFAVPYALLGSDGFLSFREWVLESSKWTREHHVWLDWPTNLSFAHAVYSWTIGLGSVNPDRLESISRVATILGAVVVLVILAVRGDRLPRIVTGAAFLCLVSLTLPTSYGYYGVFAIPIVAVILRRNADGTAWVPRPRPMTAAALAGAIVLTLTPLILPRPPVLTTPSGEAFLVGSWTPLLATTTWMLFLAVVVVGALTRPTEPTVKDGSIPSLGPPEAEPRAPARP